MTQKHLEWRCSIQCWPYANHFVFRIGMFWQIALDPTPSLLLDLHITNHVITVSYVRFFLLIFLCKFLVCGIIMRLRVCKCMMCILHIDVLYSHIPYIFQNDIHSPSRLVISITALVVVIAIVSIIIIVTIGL